MKMLRTSRFRTVIVLITVANLMFVFVGGCQSKAETGALVGAGAGAGVGGLATRSPTGAVIGGAIGAGAGYLIGREGDRRAQSREEAAAASSNEGDTVTVNVVNSNGSTTPVKLTRQGSGYVGPKGEYYSSLPTPEQLKPLYGF